jgi:(p)ppGpp synthase/HD superfamily hydrolase
MNRYEKLRTALRYFLLGRGYYKAADALEFAATYHTGKRRDGRTPEFQHQIEITHYVRTLPSLLHPEETLAVALLHDVTEDYDVPLSTIRIKYGNEIADAVARLDKNGKTPEYYFELIGLCPIASIVKGADRIHNLQTMVGVFTHEKQGRYVAEVEGDFLPMLKKARRLHVAQEAAYENIKHMLVSQVELIKEVHKAHWAAVEHSGADIDRFLQTSS